MTKLCQDILLSVISLAVEACDLEEDPMLGSVSNYGEHPSQVPPSEALITLIRLSHVNFEWRSLTLLSPRLWARHLRITKNMSPALLEEIAARTGDQAIHLHVSDIAFHGQIWLVATRLFKRCVYLCFSRRHRPDFMEFIYTTPAPALARCDIVSEAGPPVVEWKPLFAGEAPALKELRLVRTSVNRSLEQPRIPDMAHTGLMSLGVIPSLTQLELNFPSNFATYFSSPSPFAGKPSSTLVSVKQLRLTGNPFSIAHLLNAINLPGLATISVVYTFSLESVFRALNAIWQSLFQHFPSIDFPSFGIRCYDTTFEFHLLHSSSRLLKIRFDDTGLLSGVDAVEAAFAQPFIHLPPSHCERSQLLHGMAWMTLVAIPGFGPTVKTVTIASSSPNSAFPYHAHLLLSAMVEATTLQFDDRSSAWHPVWYELLLDKTSLFGYCPLPSISMIVLPASLLDSTILSNVGLRDLVCDRQRDTPTLGLHFVSLPSDSLSHFTRLTSAALLTVARAFRVNVSYELLR